MSHIDIRLGDCFDELAKIPDASVDAIITDPPYGVLKHKSEKRRLAGFLWSAAHGV